MSEVSYAQNKIWELEEENKKLREQNKSLMDNYRKIWADTCEKIVGKNYIPKKDLPVLLAEDIERTVGNMHTYLLLTHNQKSREWAKGYAMAIKEFEIGLNAVFKREFLKTKEARK